MYLQNFGLTSNLTKLKEDINQRLYAETQKENFDGKGQYAAIIKSLAEDKQLRDFIPVGKPVEIKQQIYLTDHASIKAIVRDSDKLLTNSIQLWLI